MERITYLDEDAVAGAPSSTVDNDWAELADQQPVDLDRLVECVDDDPDLARELAKMWFKQAIEQMARLEQAFRDQDAEQIRFVGHSCAGASATCGMVAASLPLRAMEKAAAEERLEEAAVEFEKFKTGMNRISQFLNLYAADLGGGVPE